MKEYKRLTKRDKNGFVEFEECEKCDYCGSAGCDSFENAVNRLAELEDKITLKQLFELPCKVGQDVYVDRDTWKNHYIVHFTCIGNKVFYYGEIVNFVITKKQILMKIRVYKNSNRLSYETARYPISAVGKTVFLTKAEAEKKFYGGKEV